MVQGKTDCMYYLRCNWLGRELMHAQYVKKNQYSLSGVNWMKVTEYIHCITITRKKIVFD